MVQPIPIEPSARCSDAFEPYWEEPSDHRTSRRHQEALLFRMLPLHQSLGRVSASDPREAPPQQMESRPRQHPVLHLVRRPPWPSSRHRSRRWRRACRCRWRRACRGSRSRSDRVRAHPWRQLSLRSRFWPGRPSLGWSGRPSLERGRSRRCCASQDRCLVVDRPTLDRPSLGSAQGPGRCPRCRLSRPWSRRLRVQRRSQCGRRLQRCYQSTSRNRCQWCQQCRPGRCPRSRDRRYPRSRDRRCPRSRARSPSTLRSRSRTVLRNRRRELGEPQRAESRTGRQSTLARRPTNPWTRPCAAVITTPISRQHPTSRATDNVLAWRRHGAVLRGRTLARVRTGKAPRVDLRLEGHPMSGATRAV